MNSVACGERRLEPEALVGVGQVVVDGLGDADDRDVEAALVDDARQLHRAAHAAVAADDEQDVDPELDEGVDHLPGVLVAARAAQDRAAVVVDVADGVQVELDDALAVLRRQARVAVAEAVDVRDAVVLGELLDDPADHVVEPGAQAAAGHDADVRGVRVEVDLPARPGRLEAGQLVDGHPALQQYGDGVVHEHAVVLVDVVRRRALGGQHLRERRVVAAVTEAADAQIVELERHGGPPGVVRWSGRTARHAAGPSSR